MICQVCGTEGVLKTFNTFQYYFCPTCKDEVKASESPEEDASSPPLWFTGLVIDHYEHAYQSLLKIADADTK